MRCQVLHADRFCCRQIRRKTAAQQGSHFVESPILHHLIEPCFDPLVKHSAVRLQNEAETYASRVVPEARGQAAQIVQQAEAYRERAFADATGQASRFNQVYDEYRKAPDVTRQRLFLETMERVFGGTDKVLIDPSAQGGSGVVPFLPLNELQRRPPQAGAQAQGATR